MCDTPILRNLTAAALLSVILAACDRGEERPPSGAAGESTAATEAVLQAANPAGRAAADERPVDSETLPYAEVDEELVYGYFAFPSDMIEPLPAVIIVHDWWGLNDDTRTAANQMAAEGYMVLAVDLYGGEIMESVEDARLRMVSVVENPQRVEDNIRQALQFVTIAGAPTRAVMGWGFGGAWTLNAAISFPDQIDAAVLYYGQVSGDDDRLAAIEAPILGLFGERDRSVKVESVRDFEAALQRLRKEHSVHVYDDTGHAFADPARGTFNAEIADDAWRRTVEFLAVSLAPEEDD